MCHPPLLCKQETGRYWAVVTQWAAAPLNWLTKLVHKCMKCLLFMTDRMCDKIPRFTIFYIPRDVVPAWRWQLIAKTNTVLNPIGQKRIRYCFKSHVYKEITYHTNLSTADLISAGFTGLPSQTVFWLLMIVGFSCLHFLNILVTSP